MGWFGCDNQSRSELIRELTRGEGMTTIASCVRGSCLWAVHESKNGERFIALYIITGGARKTGYRSMTESAGPYEVSCPLAYLEMVPDPGGYATAWRAKVRAYHARLAAGRDAVARLKPGDLIRLPESYLINEYRFVRRSKRSILATGFNGTLYRLGPDLLAKATFPDLAPVDEIQPTPAKSEPSDDRQLSLGLAA